MVAEFMDALRTLMSYWLVDIVWSTVWAGAGGGVAPGSRLYLELASLRQTCP